MILFSVVIVADAVAIVAVTIAIAIAIAAAVVVIVFVPFSSVFHSFFHHFSLDDFSLSHLFSFSFHNLLGLHI